MPMDLVKIYNAKKRLSMNDQYQILYQFQQLFLYGYSLNDALDVLMWKKQYKPIVHTMKTSLQRGQTFIETLETVKFNREITSFLSVAMQQGNLAEGLQHCCQMLRQRKNFLAKLNTLSRYPLFLFLFFLVILYFMKHSIFPAFSQLLGTNKNINTVFQYADIAINFIYYGTITSLFSIFLSFFISIIMKQQLSITTKVWFISKIPLYRTYKELQNTYLLVTHTASLLASGLTIKESFDVIKTEQASGFTHYYATTISEHLAKGYDYATILPQCPLLRDELTQIMSKDRNQEQLQKELTIYADYLLGTIESFLKKWIGLLQPILLSVLALFIVFVYLALMLPMFDYMNSL
ncbi:type II secretion system F family protein [Gracilibacillus sp. S3-1-1]|uniref:Type II secretion system F family protein n=1 Tax=Gracilibacillus pellucidus TaxID=3095368 RepID=A0ACC6M526_9BACI|nr:type II secretion system F family protein [Gracilibacillus sp. S3-1-1]MDX8046001.1 type II secretion system F family protein [Gracilibacillus sp. S3-1-1]